MLDKIRDDTKVNLYNPSKLGNAFFSSYSQQQQKQKQQNLRVKILGFNFFLFLKKKKKPCIITTYIYSYICINLCLCYMYIYREMIYWDPQSFSLYFSQFVDEIIKKRRKYRNRKEEEEEEEEEEDRRWVRFHRSWAWILGLVLYPKRSVIFSGRFRWLVACRRGRPSSMTSWRDWRKRWRRSMRLSASFHSAWFYWTMVGAFYIFQWIWCFLEMGFWF